MGRMYSAIFSAVAVSIQQDFFEVVAPSTGVVVLHAIFLSQSSEAKDAEEEFLQVAIKSGSTTSGSGGSTPTAIPLSLGDSAFGGSVEANNTTKASVGTIVTHHKESFNIRAGWAYIATPEMRKILSPSARMTVELMTTPADAITMDGTIYFEEIGT